MPRRRSAGKILRHSTVFKPEHPNRLAEVLFGPSGRFFDDGVPEMDEFELVEACLYWREELLKPTECRPFFVETRLGLSLEEIFSRGNSI